MQTYQLVTLEKVWGLQTSEHQPLNWYRYVISNGNNPITGFRNGSRAEVSAYISASITRLNLKYDLRAKTELTHKTFTKPCHLIDNSFFS